MASADPGPVAAYSFDAGEGETAEDISGNEHDGTIEGPTWTDRGKYGAALSFNGEGEDCVTVPESEQLQLTEELTLEAWVKPSGPTEDDPIIFKESLGIGGVPSYAMGIGVTNAGKPEGIIGDEAETENVEAPSAIESNVWTHLAFTYDGAKMRLYVNGALVATQKEERSPPEAPGTLKIGCSAPWWEEGFDGRIDEVRIYDRALSAGEIGGDSAAPIQTPLANPVAAYSFDAGEGETAEDAAGENDGTIEGPEWTDRGRFGNALQFNGEEGECVTVPDAEDLRTTEELTLEAWVKPTAPAENDPIIYKSSWGYTGDALGIGIWSEGKPEGLIGEGEGEFENVVGPKAIEANVWTHLAFTYDGAHMRLYVNGELVATEAQGEGPPWGEGPLVIGCNPNYAPEVFKGKIDEVRIYDRALDAGEIGADKAGPIQTPQANPVAAYSFDAGEGETLEDLSGNEHNGTIEGPEWTDRGRFGSALSFNGEGEDCVTVPESKELELTEELTLEAWVKPNGPTEDDPIIFKEALGIGGVPSYAMGIGVTNAGKPEGIIGNEAISESVEAPSKVESNVWTHLAFTYDGAHMRLYVNGALVATKKEESAPPSAPGTLKIGCSAPWWEEGFDGRIDEVRIYDRALDAGEIAGDRAAPLQTPPSGPVADYSFDEGSGETVEDLTGDEHTATIHGASWTTHGRYGGAIQFDAEKENYVSIPANTELDGNEELTFEAWVRPSEARYLGEIAMKEREGSGAKYSWTLDQHLTEPVGYFMQTEEGMVAGGEESLPLNTWTHVAMTDDGAHNRLYVNGQLVDTAPAIPFDGHGEIRLGGNGVFGQWFDGRIDELRIYDRALSEAEIQSDSASPIQTPQQGPVAAYSFDEGEGETVEDLTGEEHTATIEGAEWTRGKYGGALKFDGEDMVTIPAAEDLNLTEEFTLEAWIKPEAEGEYGHLFVKEEASGEHAAYVITKHGSKLAAHLGIPGVEEESPSGALEVGPWQHVAATYDGGRVRLYVNGELVGSAPVADILSTNGALRIGDSPIWGSRDGFKGRIDEVRIYNRALSGAEVQQAMNSTFPVAVTEAVQEVESNDAVMTGTTQVHGKETEYFFEYGPTTSYGSVATGEELEGNGEAVEVEEVAVNLAPETIYHYRLVAEGPLGTTYGKDQTFTTGERTMTVEEEEEEMSAEEAPLTEEEAPGLLKPLAKSGPGNFFGMMWDGDISQMVKAHDFDAIENSGAKMVRFVAVPGADVSDAFNEARSNNLTALPYLGQGAFPKPGTTAATEFINYAKNVVETYGPASSYETDTWEIWNEPNMRFRLNPGKEPPIFETTERQGNVRPAEFAEFYKELVKEIRSVASGIHILAPGLFGYKSEENGHLPPRAFLKRFNEALEAAPKLEHPYGGVSLHPYVFKTRNAEKHQKAHTPQNEADAKQVRKEIKGMIIGVRNLEKNMLGETKPIWVTELGFPVRSEENGRPSKTIPAVDPKEQKLLVWASFSMLFRSSERQEIEHAFYYNIEDLPGPSWEHHAGLLKEDHAPRPAWTAFSNLAGGKECPHSAPC